MSHIALLLAACMAHTAAFAQYKWTDANGRAIYGDNPPANARNVKRLSEGGPEAAAAGSLPYELRVAVERFPVTLYTGANCAPCDQGRTLLRQRGVPFTERTITYVEEVEKMKKDGFGSVLPIVVIGQQRQTGFDAAAWKLALDVSGYPEQSRLPADFKPAAPKPVIEPPKSEPKKAEDAQPQPAPKGVQTPNLPLSISRPPPPPQPPPQPPAN